MAKRRGIPCVFTFDEWLAWVAALLPPGQSYRPPARSPSRQLAGDLPTHRRPASCTDGHAYHRASCASGGPGFSLTQRLSSRRHGI
jgi:hypothetical protein